MRMRSNRTELWMLIPRLARMRSCLSRKAPVKLALARKPVLGNRGHCPLHKPGRYIGPDT
jgi:hypothetical protein